LNGKLLNLFIYFYVKESFTATRGVGASQTVSVFGIAVAVVVVV